jgi:DNA mismatch endonuclease (patch repair protein)
MTQGATQFVTKLNHTDLPPARKHERMVLKRRQVGVLECAKGYMAEVISKSKRSQIMAAIRSHGNKATELKLISIFRAQGIKGWRRHSDLPGKPDFAFSKLRLALFVDGCFWHGCRWHCRMPKTRVEYWKPKIARNKRRDSEIRKQLRSLGWRVVRIWEHSLKKQGNAVTQLCAMLGNGPQTSLNGANNASAPNHSARIRRTSRHALRQDYLRVPRRNKIRKFQSV